MNNNAETSAGQARPPKPMVYPVHPESIPSALQNLPQWVVWRWFWAADKGKWDKPPLQSHGGNAASSTNQKTWSPHEDAMNTYIVHGDKFDGIGFVFAKHNHLVGIDLDHCRNPETGNVDPWAQQIIDTFATYTEVSPSGTGIHLIAQGNLPGKGIKTAQGEMYDTGRYLTITGHILPGIPSTMAPRQDRIDQLYQQLREKQAGAKMTAEPASNGTGPSPDVEDEIIMKKALACSSNGCKIRPSSGLATRPTMPSVTPTAHRTKAIVKRIKRSVENSPSAPRIAANRSAVQRSGCTAKNGSARTIGTGPSAGRSRAHRSTGVVCPRASTWTAPR